MMVETETKANVGAILRGNPSAEGRFRLLPPPQQSQDQSHSGGVIARTGGETGDRRSGYTVNPDSLIHQASA